MTAGIRKIYTGRGLTPPKCRKGVKHHTAAFHRMVAGIKKSGGADSPHAVAVSILKKQGKSLFKK